MSPSSTIHLGPLWLILASSRIMLEKRPAGRCSLGIGLRSLNNLYQSHTTPARLCDHHLSTLWSPGWWCQKARHWSQPLGWGLPTQVCASFSGRSSAATSLPDSFQCLHSRLGTQSDAPPAAPPAAPPNTHRVRQFIYAFLSIAWRALKTVSETNKHWPFNNSNVDNRAFHGPLHCGTQSTAFHS